MIVSIKKIMLLGVMVSCLGILLYSMPERPVTSGKGNDVAQAQMKELAKINF